MASYFTILHIAALVFFFILFIALLILSFKETRKKVLVAMIFSNFLVITTLSFFSMLVLDKYTKKARLENVTQSRVLLTESFVLSGVVRNIGKFDISKCYLNVKLVNNPVTGKNLSGSTVFKPNGFDFLSNSENERKSTIKKSFVIAKNLKAGEFRNFSVSMRYPPYFKNTSLVYKLKCR